MRSLWIPVVGLALAASGCGGGGAPAVDAPSDTGSEGSVSLVDGPARTCVPLSEFENGDVANAPIEERDFTWNRPDPVVADGFDASLIIPGGPPPDGILPIDNPCFDTVAAADEWLTPQSPVMVVEVGDDVRAYPLAILTQHEIVNDVIGGEPVVVTYCPLCNSGLAFERTVGSDVLDFGTSGRLFQSNLVMYDRQTKTLWSQFTGRAVVGRDYVGVQLERLSTALLGWREFVEAAPDGHVLSSQSVPGRVYGRNPYPGYEGYGDDFLFAGPRDETLPPNARVVGIGADRDPVAIALDHLREQRVVEVDVDGAPVTAWWAPGQASALDEGRVDDGLDVGSTGVFLPVAPDGAELTFSPATDDDGRFVDDQTGSTWNLLGTAVDGPLEGERLESLPRDDTFYFVWYAFQPDTRVVGEGEPEQ